MEYCLGFCCASKPTDDDVIHDDDGEKLKDSPAAKWALVLATLCTAVFPLVDFVTDILLEGAPSRAGSGPGQA